MVGTFLSNLAISVDDLAHDFSRKWRRPEKVDITSKYGRTRSGEGRCTTPNQGPMLKAAFQGLLLFRQTYKAKGASTQCDVSRTMTADNEGTSFSHVAIIVLALAVVALVVAITVAVAKITELRRRLTEEAEERRILRVSVADLTSRLATAGDSIGEADDERDSANELIEDLIRERDETQNELLRLRSRLQDSYPAAVRRDRAVRTVGTHAQDVYSPHFMTVDGLRQELRHYRLSARGLRGELVNRLVEHYRSLMRGNAEAGERGVLHETTHHPLAFADDLVVYGGGSASTSPARSQPRRRSGGVRFAA